MPFEARGDIDAVSENIVVIEDDVAKWMPIRNSILRSGDTSTFRSDHRMLDFHRKTRGIDRAGELDQHAVAGRFDDTTAM